MKGYFKGLVLWVSLLGLSSCDHSPAPDMEITILLSGHSRQPQVDGFIAGMREQGYYAGRNTTYHIFNAANDRHRLDELAAQLLSHEPDLLVAAGGLETDTFQRAVAKLTSPPPVVVLFINGIQQRGTIKERLRPGWSVTGIDNLNAELSGKRLSLFKELLPDLRRVLVFYSPGIDPSKMGLAQARHQARKEGVELIATAIHQADELPERIAELQAGDYDGVLTVPSAPISNAFHRHALPRLQELGIPVFTHVPGLVDEGALASYGAPFYDMGQQAARLAAKVLQGVPAEHLPFETPKAFHFRVNQQTLERLGLELNPLSRAQVDELINP